MLSISVKSETIRSFLPTKGVTQNLDIRAMTKCGFGPMTLSRQVRLQGHEAAGKMPNARGGAFLEAALIPARADDKTKKMFSLSRSLQIDPDPLSLERN
jgi:hypothetical protein